MSYLVGIMKTICITGGYCFQTRAGGLIEEVDKVRLKGLQVVLLTPECTDEEVEEEGCQPRHLSDEAVDSFSSARAGGLIEEVDKVRPRGSKVVLLTLDCTDEEVEE